MEHNMSFIPLLCFMAFFMPTGGSITSNQRTVLSSLPSPAPSPFSPHPSPYYPSSLLLCPSPELPPPPLSPNPPPLPPNPPTVPSNPPPHPPNTPPLPPNMPPLSPTPPVPFLPPPPHAPPPLPPNATCFSGLLTCKNNNISDPSTICCDNLKIVYEKDEDCICTVLESQYLSKELGLNATDISKLLVDCKIVDVPINLCNSVPAPAPSTPNPSPPPLPNEATMMTKQVWMIIFFGIIMFFNSFML